MNEEAQPSPEPEVAQTLDDVISEFNVAPTTQAAEPTPVEPTPQYTHVDPLDNDQWNNYQREQSQHQAALQGQLRDLSTKLDSYEQERVQTQVDTDIKTAVDQVSKGVDGSDPLMIELYLEKRARENDGFRNIWENRANNPKALNKALGAITNELQGKFSIKADPQLAENQRAIQQSQISNSQNAPNYANSIEESLGNSKSEAEWESAWENAVRG